MIQLEVKDLTKRFGRKKVFQGLNFTQNSGVLGISGGNGSGKSTLVRCLSFLLKPQSGKISWFDEGEAISTNDFKKIVGICAPYLNLYSEFSAFENCSFHAQLKQKQSSREELEALAVLCGVRFSLDQTFGSLSSGQQQRVKLMSAFSAQSRIILLDEPGSNLDERGNEAVKLLVKKAREESRFVVLASNVKSELDLCDSIFPID